MIGRCKSTFASNLKLIVSGLALLGRRSEILITRGALMFGRVLYPVLPCALSYKFTTYSLMTLMTFHFKHYEQRRYRNL